MNAPTGFDRILDLQAAISKYCSLSPDRYARAHYESALEGVPRDGVLNVAASWQWLHDRLVADKQPPHLKNIADDDCVGRWWESWENG